MRKEYAEFLSGHKVFQKWEPKAPLVRIFHPYTIWEDYLGGMWRDVTKTERDSLLSTAIVFTGDAVLYGSFMQRVIREWPVTCEHNLSDAGQNRRAFVGHAAACLAHTLPEHVTREAWGHLTQDQQDAANLQADCAISEWLKLHEAKNQKLHRKMGTARISRGHPGRSSAEAGSRVQGSKLSLDLQGDHEK